MSDALIRTVDGATARGDRAGSIPSRRRRPPGLVRIGRVSVRIDRRSTLVSVVLVGVVAAGLAWSVSVGDFPIPLADVVGEITGLSGSTDSAFVIRVLRLPRGLTAVLVGAAFGMSGLLFQRLVRNPLASPDILGVSAGAGAAAVACIVLAGASSSATVAGAALAGAFATVGAMYLLALRDGLSPYRLVLVGIGLTAVLKAVVSYLLTRAQQRDAGRAMLWITGSLNGRGWEYVRPLGLALLVLTPLALVAARRLRVLELGDDLAAGLGVSRDRTRAALALCATGLAAVATAAAGPVAFVALLAPLIARRLTGPGAVALVPSALVGAALVVYGDLAGRRLAAPTELPVGVVTAVLGAPCLLWLLARADRIGRGG